MGSIIFEEMIKKPKSTKKWLFIPGSFIFHLLAIAALVVTPLITADIELPPVATYEVVVAAPSSLPMPVGRKGTPGAKGGKAREEKAKKDVKKAPQADKFVAPVEIPDTIEEDDFLDLALPANEGWGDGLVEGALEGDINGVLGALPGDGSSTQPLYITRVEQVPSLIKKVKPAYPEPARLARIQGRVIIEADTDIYGRVVSTRVISGNPLLIKAALEAVKQWVYEPYIINGHPKPVRFSVTLTFTLSY